MKLKITNVLTLLLIVVISSTAFSLPRRNPTGRDPFVNRVQPDIPLQFLFLDGNNISAIFYNWGIFDQDPRTNNHPGFEWPKGSGKYACFTAGLCIACMIDTSTVPGVPAYAMGQVMASYRGEYTPGYIISGITPIPQRGNDYKLYKVKSGDNAYNNPDWANWGLMVPFGAPFVDVNNDGQYDPLVDIAGMKNASQTIFMTCTDAFIDQKNPGEGFGGGVNTPLLYAEVHFTAWCYSGPGLEDLQFINWVIINKGNRPWERTWISVVVDPDLGNADDDYIGCDTTLNLGFCYNGDNDDPVYGVNPPAFGMDYFKSPIIRATNDTLGLTSFTFFTNTSGSPPPCESDPNGEPYPAYLNMQGFKKDSTAYVDPLQPTGGNCYKKVKFVYPGDPEPNTGWTEFKGSLRNCGGDSCGTPIQVNAPADRRFIFSSGRLDFVVNPNDTQNVVLAQFAARGSSNVNSVTRLKSLSKTAQLIYDNNFNVTPPPPAPEVTYSFTPTVSGLCNITLTWSDISETFRYWDTIFYTPDDSNIYYFEGYEIYEISRFAQTVPDFTKPETIDPTNIALVDIFDKRNNVGIIIDTFSTGVTINGNEQFAPYPIVPPYKLGVPANFPNSGISRSITLTKTQFPNNYGGQTSFIYGQEYRFAVVAYAYSGSTKIRRGFKVLRNSVGAQTLKIRPIAPPAGTYYTYKNGDTLDVKFPIRDLGLCPIIRNQNLLLNATYRIVFNPDTTYNILRKIGSDPFVTLKTGLKYNPTKVSTDDSSRTIDGIYFNLQKIRYTSDGSVGGYTGNFGVIKDPTLSPDSIQTRKYGWEYTPAQNLWLTGAKVVINNQDPKFQSKSMSLTYPAKNVYNSVGSAIKPDGLRVIKIEFSNDTSKQQYAYRYLARTNFPLADPSFAPYVINTTTANNFYIYQDKRKVPFTVWEVDPTDSSEAPRQLNCAFLETNDSIPRGKIDGKWDPSPDSTGCYEFLYIFNSTYGDPAWDAFYATTSRNLYITANIDVMYVWAARRINSSANFTEGDAMYIYPYTVTRPYVASNVPTKPLFYEFDVVAPKFGDPNYAKETNALDKIKVVPNPYYGFSTLDRSLSDKFVTFRHLPLKCTIKIYTLNGDLIKTLEKNDPPGSTNSTLEWNLQNESKVPVASGIYIALIDAPGIGTKVIKIVVFTAQERINF